VAHGGDDSDSRSEYRPELSFSRPRITSLAARYLFN